MAIFNERDASIVPLATQFYQIQVPQGWQKQSSLLPGSELDQWRILRDKINRTTSSIDYDLTEYDLTVRMIALWNTARLHSWIVPLMDAIADTPEAVPLNLIVKVIHAERIRCAPPVTLVDVEDKEEQDRLVAAGEPSVPIWALGGTNVTALQENEVPQTSRVSLHLLNWDQPDDWYLDDTDRVIQEVAKATRLEIALRRCDACNSVFVVRRARQHYCSERCLSRGGARKRRAKKPDEVPYSLVK